MRGASVMMRLPVPLRLALRDLRGGFRGFGVFIGCLVLGVAALASVSSLSRALTDGLSREGRRFIGADFAVSLVQREASEEESNFLKKQGVVSSIATMRAMAVAGEKGTALVNAKAVDDAYPSVGTLVTDPPLALRGMFDARDGAFGVVVDPALLARLGVTIGERFTLGQSVFEIRARLVSEPDSLADGVGLGPAVLISQEALRQSALLQPGSLVRWTYRVLLPPNTGDAELQNTVATVTKAFPQAGWETRTRTQASPQLARSIERFTQFLSLVGITTLIVGGVGIANAVNGLIDARRGSIAIMKSLGLEGHRLILTQLTQVLLVAALAVGVGLVIGAVTPFIVAYTVADLLPLPLDPHIAPFELAAAALYGLLVALAFALVPLGRMRNVPVAALFRDGVVPDKRRASVLYYGLSACTLAALALLTWAFAADRRVALIFLASMAGAFLALRLVAFALVAGMRRLPRPRSPGLRLAVSNIARPGAPTPSVILSVGLSVALLTAIAVIDANLTQQLTRSLPERAPNFFVLDIPGNEGEAFDHFVDRSFPGSAINRVPLMRGRIVSVNGVPAEAVKAQENAAWVLEGDRGLTYASTVPEGSTLDAGAWWDSNTAGRPLVSVDAEIARGLGLGVGGKIAVNVLGRVIEAEVASLRKVEWRSLGINFVMVFSPNTFVGAPHTDLATVSLPGENSPDRDAAFLKDMTKDFPTLTAVSVRESLDAINDLVGKLMTAIRSASLVALLSSTLVLGGALAAGQRARLYDTVIMKTLGATRLRLISAAALEFALLGCVSALIGLVAGMVASWFVVGRVMALSFSPNLVTAFTAALCVVLVAVCLGLVGAWRALGHSAAQILRAV